MPKQTMTDRDRLIELLHLTPTEFGKTKNDLTDNRCFVEFAADYLLANGVIVPQWISVNDKLPEENTRVLVYRPNQFYEIHVVSRTKFDWEKWDTDWSAKDTKKVKEHLITHWMPLPEPPRTPKERGDKQ